MYGIVSDTHLHGWSAFSKLNADKVNNRLQIIMNEIERAGDAVLAAGGNLLVHAGDCFHVRGKVAPDVLNPARDLFRRMTAKGLRIVMLAGNHDLTSDNAEALHNASRALEDVGVKVIDAPVFISTEDKLVMFAWEPSCSKLLERMRLTAEAMNNRKAGVTGNYDAIIHAPVNGVIVGLPDHGLEAAQLAALGFKRVFVGHYHNHQQMADGRVISVGATTHQTWSDVGAVAGFLTVDDFAVTHHPTLAPRFIDLDGISCLDDVAGNYVRIAATIESEAEIGNIRNDLMAAGAFGVVVKPSRKKVDVRREISTEDAKGLVTIEGSIQSYIDRRHDGDKDLYELCIQILNEEQEA